MGRVEVGRRWRRRESRPSPPTLCSTRTVWPVRTTEWGCRGCFRGLPSLKMFGRDWSLAECSRLKEARRRGFPLTIARPAATLQQTSARTPSTCESSALTPYPTGAARQLGVGPPRLGQARMRAAPQRTGHLSTRPADAPTWLQKQAFHPHLEAHTTTLSDPPIHHAARRRYPPGRGSGLDGAFASTLYCERGVPGSPASLTEWANHSDLTLPCRPTYRSQLLVRCRAA